MNVSRSSITVPGNSTRRFATAGSTFTHFAGSFFTAFASGLLNFTTIRLPEFTRFSTATLSTMNGFTSPTSSVNASASFSPLDEASPFSTTSFHPLPGCRDFAGVMTI